MASNAKSNKSIIVLRNYSAELVCAGQTVGSFVPLLNLLIKKEKTKII